MTNQSLIEVRNVTCRIGGNTIVNDVSFTTAPGTTFGVIGPNGAGKTSLFNIVSGFMKQTSGEVIFDGVPLPPGQGHKAAQRGIGRTFQTVKVFRELSVLENLQVADSLSKRSGQGSFADRAEDALRLVGMERFAGYLAGNMSYGQQKLVEIAMVLINRPRLILLDEPVSGVNPVVIAQITEVLKELRRRGLTLLLVEHNVPFVTDLCDRVLVMAAGARLTEGTPEEVQKDPRVLEAFLGG